MKKIDWNHPITRKDYAMVYGFLFGVVATMYIISLGIIYWTKINACIRRKIEWIREKLPW